MVLHHWHKSSHAQHQPSRHSTVQRRFGTTPFLKIISTTPRVLPVVPAIESHLQPDPDCCTVCAVANLVTSNTTLETQVWFYDGGLRAITVTSVSGHLVRLGSTVAAVTGDDVACIAPLNFFQMLARPRRNTVAFIETTLLRLIRFFVVHLRASSDGITKVCGEMILAQLSRNCSRMLVSTWLAWRSIQVLEMS